MSLVVTEDAGQCDHLWRRATRSCPSADARPIMARRAARRRIPTRAMPPPRAAAMTSARGLRDRRMRRHAARPSRPWAIRPAGPNAPCSIRWCASTWRRFSPPPPATIPRGLPRSSSRSSAAFLRLWRVGPRLRAVSVRTAVTPRRSSPFSCKRRGFCPSCRRPAHGRRCGGARSTTSCRMFPCASGCSLLPHALRHRLAWDHASAAPCSRSTPARAPRLRASSRAAARHHRWSQRHGHRDSTVWRWRPAQRPFSHATAARGGLCARGP